LRKLVPQIPQNEEIIKYPDPIVIKTFIKSSIEFIYNTIINLELRKEWSNGLIKIDYNKDEIPHIGSKHNCELQSGSFELETVHKGKTKNKLQYAERANNNKLLPNSTTLFIIEKNNNGSDLTINFSYKRYPIIGYLIDLIVKKKIKRNISSSALNLRNYCEQNFRN
jgi:hypothetical protein